MPSVSFIKCGIAYKGRDYVTNGSYTDESGNKYNDNQMMATTWNMMPGDYFRMDVYNFMGYYQIADGNIDYVFNQGLPMVFGAIAHENGRHGTSLMGTRNQWTVECINGGTHPALRIIFDGAYGDTDGQLGSVIHDHTKNRVDLFNRMMNHETPHTEGTYTDTCDIPYYQQQNNVGIIKRKPIWFNDSNNAYLHAYNPGEGQFSNKFYTTLYAYDAETYPRSAAIFADIENQLYNGDNINIITSNTSRKCTGYYPMGNKQAPWAGVLSFPTDSLHRGKDILSCLVHDFPQSPTLCNQEAGAILPGWMWPRRVVYQNNTYTISTMAGSSKYLLRPFRYQSYVGGRPSNGRYMSAVLFKITELHLSNASLFTTIQNYDANSPTDIVNTLPTFAIFHGQNDGMRILANAISATYQDFTNTSQIAAYGTTLRILSQYCPRYIALSRNLYTNEGTWGILARTYTNNGLLDTPTNDIKVLILPSLTSDNMALDIYSYGYSPLNPFEFSLGIGNTFEYIPNTGLFPQNVPNPHDAEYAWVDILSTNHRNDPTLQ